MNNTTKLAEPKFRTQMCLRDRDKLEVQPEQQSTYEEVLCIHLQHIMLGETTIKQHMQWNPGREPEDQEDTDLSLIHI